MAAMFVLAVFWKFKDRIFEFLGVENGALFTGDLRDWATCWSMHRFQALELCIWKVEGLPSAKISSANDVFAEVRFGYNVNMTTRVHLRAGHSCIFKESMQMNWDPFDRGTRLTLTVKNQGVLGGTDIAQK